MKLPVRTVRATRYVMPFRQGGSVPALVEGDDDGMYVVKLRGASQGEKALIAEFVSGELGRALGLAVPELVFVELDAAIAAAEPDPELCMPLSKSLGLNLGLDFLPASVTYDPLVGPHPDAEMAARIVLFDAFVSNVDRTVRNANLLTWHRSTWLIDHGASLYFHHGWRPEDPLEGSADPFAEVRDHVLLTKIGAGSTSLRSAAERMRTTLDDSLIDGLIDRIPEAWLALDRAWDDVASHRDAYRAWLRARREAIPLLLQEAERARG
jgi:hypothetical protein